MRTIRIALALILVSTLVVSCAKKKEMTMEDFVKIDLQITPTMDDKQIEEVAKKYGFTIEQYREFADMVQKDPKLQEQRGEVRLKDQKEGM